MATEKQIDQAIEGLVIEVTDVGDDTKAWTQEESAQIYEGVAAECLERAATIRGEIAANAQR